MAIKTSHTCDKAAEIAEINTKVHSLWQSIEGNGQPGLKHTLTELNVTVQELKKSIDGRNAAIDSLKVKKTGWLIALAGVVVTFLNILLTHI